MSINTILSLVLVALLGYVGYQGYNHVYDKGYQAAVSEIKEANEAAIREKEQIQKEEGREIAKVIPLLEKNKKYYAGLLEEVKNLPKPVELKEESLENVKIIRVYGLSEPALRLYNDAVRGEERTPKVRPNVEEALRR